MFQRALALVARAAIKPGDAGAGGPRAQQVAQAFLDLLYPRSCLSCDQPVEESGAYRFLCNGCARLVRFAGQPACRTCGYPFFGAAEGELACEHCAELTPRFTEGRTAVLLRGPARDLIHELKYRRQIHLVRDIRAILAASPDLAEFVRGGYLVPVPLHPRKERERTFNQSRLIARELAAIAPTRGLIEAVVRVLDTESQTRFDRKARRENLKNAFAINNKCALNPAQRYILVDDVFTTGSTLNACAAALRRKGLKRIDVVTFGHG